MTYITPDEHGIIDLGKAGTSGAITVRFPLADGTVYANICHKRSEDRVGYCKPITVSEEYAEWLIDATDTAFSGSGLAEVIYYDKTKTTINKSSTYHTIVEYAVTDIVEGDEQSVIQVISNVLVSKLDTKQDKLIAGTGISVDGADITLDDDTQATLADVANKADTATVTEQVNALDAKISKNAADIVTVNTATAKAQSSADAAQETADKAVADAATAQATADGKQDPISAGKGITVADNVVSMTNGENIYAGNCDTGANTSPKVITIANYTPKEGDIIRIKFTDINYVDKFHLSINGKDYTVMESYGANYCYGQAKMWDSGEVVEFMLSGDRAFMLNRHRANYLFYGMTTYTDSLSTKGYYAVKAELIKSELDKKQDNLTAGDNIQLDGATISATDTTYSAGTNVSIDENNAISAVDTMNTAGATDNSDGAMYLIGATEQGDAKQTYTQENLYSARGSLFAANLHSAGAVTAENNVLAGENVIAQGEISAAAAKIDGEVTSGSVYAGEVNSSGDIAALGDIKATGSVSADTVSATTATVTGTVTAGKFSGDGSGLTNIPTTAIGAIATMQTAIATAQTTADKGVSAAAKAQTAANNAQATADTKQDALTAGDGITINGATISTNKTRLNVYTATCTTAEDVSPKVIEIDGYTPVEGDVINILMTNGNSKAPVSLSVNDTAYNLVRTTAASVSSFYWVAGEMVQVVYHGDYFYLMDSVPATSTNFGTVRLGNGLENNDYNVPTGKTVVSALAAKQNTLVAGDGITIDGSIISADNARQNAYYAVCETAADTQIKEITIADYTLKTGDLISIRFIYPCSVSAPKLSINGETAKYMAGYHTTGGSGYIGKGRWRAGEVVSFIYDGSLFVSTEPEYASTSSDGLVTLANGLDDTTFGVVPTAKDVRTALAGKQDTLTAGTGITIADNAVSLANSQTLYAECETEEDTAVKAITIDGYTPKQGDIIHIRMLNGNSRAPVSLSLNDTISSLVRSHTEDKATSVSNYMWVAGEIISVVYDGTYWMMLNANPATATSFGSVRLGNGLENNDHNVPTGKTVVEALAAKQGTLTAGDNITISDNVISAAEARLNVYYAECSTTADVQKKEVTIADYEPQTGDQLNIRMYYGNTSSMATLSVNGGTEVPMLYKHETKTTGYVTNKYWEDGELVSVVYDGSYWIMQSSAPATVDNYGKVLLTDEVSYNKYLVPHSYAVAAAIGQKQDKFVTGDGIDFTDNTLSIDEDTMEMITTASDTATTAQASATAALNGLTTKQDTLTAGDGIDITDNVISTTVYTAGTGIDLKDNAISIKQSESVYAVCTTAEDVQIKTIAVDGYTLKEGDRIAVKFNETNAVAQPKLKVNSKTCYIVLHYSDSTLQYMGSGYWSAGDVVEFVYDGKYMVTTTEIASNVNYGLAKISYTLNNTESGTAIAPSAVKKAINTPKFRPTPEYLVAIAGEEVSLSVANSITDTTSALSYQWQMSTNGEDWGDCTVVENQQPTMHFTAKSGYNGYLFHCVVTLDETSITTDPAYVYVFTGAQAELADG